MSPQLPHLAPREIFAAIQDVDALVKLTLLSEVNTEGRALIALRDLLVSFINATESAGREATQWMSIDQVRLLNQLHLAVGL